MTDNHLSASGGLHTHMKSCDDHKDKSLKDLTIETFVTLNSMIRNFSYLAISCDGCNQTVIVQSDMPDDTNIVEGTEDNIDAIIKGLCGEDVLPWGNSNEM